MYLFALQLMSMQNFQQQGGRPAILVTLHALQVVWLVDLTVKTTDLCMLRECTAQIKSALDPLDTVCFASDLWQSIFAKPYHPEQNHCALLASILLYCP